MSGGGGGGRWPCCINPTRLASSPPRNPLLLQRDVGGHIDTRCRVRHPPACSTCADCGGAAASDQRIHRKQGWYVAILRGLCAVSFLFHVCSVFHTQPTLHAHAEADYLRSSDVWVVRVARVQLPSCSLPGTTSSRTSLWLWQELNTGRYW